MNSGRGSNHTGAVYVVNQVETAGGKQAFAEFIIGLTVYVLAR